jgi:hypothetical protein
MRQELIDQKFYEINSRFIEIYETRKLYDWQTDVNPLDGTKPYMVYGHFVSNVDAYIEDINDSSVSVSTLYNVFDEFKMFVMKNHIKPVMFEHLNVVPNIVKGDGYKFVVVYKTYVFGIN